MLPEELCQQMFKKPSYALTNEEITQVFKQLIDLKEKKATPTPEFFRNETGTILTIEVQSSGKNDYYAVANAIASLEDIKLQCLLKQYNIIKTPEYSTEDDLPF